MRKAFINVLAVLVTVVMLFSLITGCGSSNQEQNNDNQPAKSEAASPSSSVDTGTSASGPEEITLPIVKEPVTLNCFWQMDGKASMVIKSYNEMEVFKEMAKRTGITINFIHPAAEQAEQQFNLMLVSDDLPDLVWYDWSKYPGGMSKLIQDGVFLKLNDQIEKYAPNITKALIDNPEWKKQIVLDDGTFYMFPKIKKDTSILVTSGFQMRKDWLERVNKKEPTNADEWYDVLKAFKDEDANGNGDPNDEIPYGTFKDNSYGVNQLSLFFGLTDDFYQSDGKIKYGPVEPAFKDYVSMLNKWYGEGLIDPDYLATDRAGFESKVISNKVGSYFGMANGFMAKFQGVWGKEHPDYQLEPLASPVANDGKKYCRVFQSQISNDGMAISKTNKYVNESIKYLDYLYGTEGSLLNGYGIEGKSYGVVNGVPTFTDEILKNADGLPAINALHKYTYSVSTGPGYQTEAIMGQMATYPQVKATYDTWAKDAIKINLTNLSSTEDEGKKLSKIMGDIKTYQEEMFHKFIMGMEPLDKYDEYVKKIKDMGIDEAIAIEQAMLDRYNAK